MVRTGKNRSFSVSVRLFTIGLLTDGPDYDYFAGGISAGIFRVVQTNFHSQARAGKKGASDQV